MKKILYPRRAVAQSLFAILSHLLLQDDTVALHSSSIVSRSLIPNIAQLRSRERLILRLQEPKRSEDDETQHHGNKDFDDLNKFSQSDEDVADNSPETFDETRRLIEAQQKQIDMLMKLVQPKVGQSSTEESGSSEEDSEPDPPPTNVPPKSFSFPSPNPPNPVFGSSLAPLKTMLFIDGTWLYYSIYERKGERDLISQKFGMGWQYKYFVDWQRLPRIICEALQEQDQGWSSLSNTNSEGKHSSTAGSRPFEIVRAMVFTSFKADTPKTSFRYQMYQDMINANYDVHMMETVGRNEKCIDIQLAVEMLHFATVTNAYDVALLLSGDKDFMPAMARTRQKGRSVGLVSMRAGCNKALVESPNIKDYDPVWIEDYLDELIMPRNANSALHERKSPISSFTFMKVIYDFISQSGHQRVASRDIGRYLKELKIGHSSLLVELKQCYGGIYQFLTMLPEVYNVDLPEYSGSDHTYWVGSPADATVTLLEEAKKTQFTQGEKDFFENYSLEDLEDKETWYWYTSKLSGGVPLGHAVLDAPKATYPIGQGKAEEVALPEELTCDYTTLKVAELKERCRELGLPVSGKKSELLARIQQHVNEEIANLKATTSRRPEPKRASTKLAEEYLLGLVEEYVHARGGRASSRDIGRYLATTKASEDRLKGESRRLSALQELKEVYGSLKYFLSNCDLFNIEESEKDSDYEYQVSRSQALRVV